MKNTKGNEKIKIKKVGGAGRGELRQLWWSSSTHTLNTTKEVWNQLSPTSGS